MAKKKQEQKRPGITRFAVLPDERRLMLGIDKSNAFEAGYVYEAINLLDQIVVRKIGKYALPSTANERSSATEHSCAETVIYSGSHLITEKEEEFLINHGY